MTKMDDDDKKVAVELHNMGLTYGEVASELKVSIPGLNLVYKKERERGVYVSDEKSNIKRLNYGIRRYFSDMYLMPYSREINERVKDIFERRGLKKIIRYVKDSITIDDLVNSGPEQRLLYAVYKYPEPTQDMIGTFLAQKPDNYDLEDFKSHVKKYMISIFENNYISPIMIDSDKISQELSRLYPNEQMMLEWNKYNEDPQKKIADEIGVSRSRIGQIVDQGLRKLRHSDVIEKNRYPIVLSEYFKNLEQENEMLLKQNKTLELALKVFTGQENWRKVYLDLDKSSEEIKIEKNREKSVDKISMSERARNCLKNRGIKNLGQLADKTKKYMLKTKNAGPKTCDEYERILNDFDLEFTEEE